MSSESASVLALRERLLEMMRHALGYGRRDGGHPLKPGWRNRYVVTVNGQAHRDWEAARAAGYVVLSEADMGESMKLYHVTDAGIAAVAAGALPFVTADGGGGP